MSEAYRRGGKVGEHAGAYYRKSQKGMEVEGNSEREMEV
jgi:hypothetical protein